MSFIVPRNGKTQRALLQFQWKILGIAIARLHWIPLNRLNWRFSEFVDNVICQISALSISHLKIPNRKKKIFPIIVHLLLIGCYQSVDVWLENSKKMNDLIQNFANQNISALATNLLILIVFRLWFRFDQQCWSNMHWVDREITLMKFTQRTQNCDKIILEIDKHTEWLKTSTRTWKS